MKANYKFAFDGDSHVLSTDVEGSTKLWEQYPGLAAEVMTHHDLLVE